MAVAGGGECGRGDQQSAAHEDLGRETDRFVGWVVQSRSRLISFDTVIKLTKNIMTCAAALETDTEGVRVDGAVKKGTGGSDAKAVITGRDRESLHSQAGTE